MTREETVLLARYVKALCPQQAIDAYTPIAWHDLLGDYDLNEARAAVVAVASRQPFVAPSDIVAECKRTRARALEQQRSEAIIEPVRRRQLADPRLVREQIDAIFARFGRPELLPAAPPSTAPDKPRHVQLAELEAMSGGTL